MATVHVKTRNHFLLDGRRLLNPGSVIPMEEDVAKDFVKRRLGEVHPGPAFEAPSHRAPAREEAIEPERADLGSRLDRAEKAVSTGRRAGAA